MIFIKDGYCKCENCLDDMHETEICFIKWPGIGEEQFICKTCADLFVKWKKEKDRTIAKEYYNKFIDRSIKGRQY